jgi:spermidine synthase
MIWFSLFFFLSGLCSIVYELVWLRLAMAKFGVTTALVSIVLSVFMAGLGLGSWLAGVAVRRYGDRIKFSPLRIYGIIELAIGVSALVVPLEIAWGSRLLERMAGTVSISSGSYYLVSGLWLVVTLVPWCACMGATIPVAMFAIGKYARAESQRSFSLLYLANVVGAVGGACVAPVLIELYGFHGTLRVGAVLNALIFVSAIAVAARFGVAAGVREVSTSPTHPKTADEWGTRVPSGTLEAPSLGRADNSALLLLFTTGLTTMAAEVIWIRLYTFYIGPVVYSFAAILASYLAATFVGSKLYRVWSRRGAERDMRPLWISLAFLGLLPLVTADPRIIISYSTLRVVLGVVPFAGVIGFLTPMLVDRWSGGDPDRAGRAYAVNVLGCIVGPLLAGFVLLPLFGERVSMLLLALPWLSMALLGRRKDEPAWQLAFNAGILIASLTLFSFTEDYEALYRGLVRRDSTATVIAAGQGKRKGLLVNGCSMTALSAVTKMMAHFTLSHLQQRPRNALIICFGMGTTFRSAMTWDIPVTVVELVPSVPQLFTYFHPDSGELLNSPHAHIVIDDGRRFLDRSAERFDAIIIDPPPPIDAAGSSLLYSREFYELAKAHLSSQGILQQWFLASDDADKAAEARAITDVFPYVRVFPSIYGKQVGYHFLASMQPIPERTASDLVARMSPAAISDMMEWGPAATPDQQFELMLQQNITPEQLIALSPNTPEMDDDRPINEYDRLRSMFAQPLAAAPPQP